MADIRKEIEKRRTFAIISHPDAGKTTLTEKFLLYGGAINLAGSVKGKATARHAVSDWMEIEKERGISVTSSVLQFNYDNYCINILDTPGHQDFSEDTYRTLMAADSAVMVIDGSKGVEAQTRKLFKVCVMRHIPIFTFINKMDRDANDTFDLLDEIEKELGIATCPINWPIGSGKKFRGVYDRESQKIHVFSDTEKGTKEGEDLVLSMDEADGVLLEGQKEKLMDEIDLLDGASAEFDQEMVDKGELSPVFFGSALTNFGVEIFLKHFLKMTTSPLPRKADVGMVDPMEDSFSGFIFKIQANMNKAHRDRIAFMRICSGKFEAGMEVLHVQDGKKIREEADVFISSMPIRDLVGGMNDVPEKEAKIAAGLPYRDYRTLGVLVRKLNLKNKTKIKTVGNIVPDNWVYVHDRNVQLGRFQIYNNWSPYMVVDLEHTVWIGLEYFCNEGDKLWNMSDQEFSDFAVDEIIKMGMIDSKDDVLDTHSESVKKAYPAYFDTYEEIDTLIHWLNGIDNLYCVGRNGQHRYNNIDHSMCTSFEVVHNIVNCIRDRSNIWNVNTEKEYHEAKN